jgi:hypothetical protein
MNLRAKANGMMVEILDAEAEAYLSTGLYDRIDDEPESTKVEPLTTKDMPTKKSKKKGQ